MSEFIVTCPTCGQEYRLNNIQGLIKAECEKCGEVFIIEQPYTVVAPKEVKVEERIVTVKANDERVNEIAEELKKVKKDTGVVAFICWPIAISMVLGFVGLIIKGLIIAGAGAGDAGTVGLLFGVIIFFCVICGIISDDDNNAEIKHKEDNDADLRYRNYTNTLSSSERR